MLLSPARWRKTSPARYYQQHYSGFGKTLAKLCSGIYIRLEVLYCRTEVVISNQGSIIHLKKRIRPLLWVPECKVKTKPINRHFNPLLICYISWIRIEWIVFNLHAALFVIVLGPMWHLPNFKDFFYSKGSCEMVKIVTSIVTAGNTIWMMLWHAEHRVCWTMMLMWGKEQGRKS